MAKPLVYLAGQISGLSYDGAVDWRKDAITRLDAEGITGLSPMRGKEYLSEMKDLDKNCIEYGEINVLSSPGASLLATVSTLLVAIFF